MLNFCTLFDSYYLDKGIALYQSLEQVSDNFTLYVFCFDDSSFEILKERAYDHMVVLHHAVFETQELLEIKQNIAGLVQLLLLNMYWNIILWIDAHIWIQTCIFMRIHKYCLRR